MAQGISAETPLEMFYREARAARIYDGPDEAHRMVVARQIVRAFGQKSDARRQTSAVRHQTSDGGPTIAAEPAQIPVASSI